MNSIHLQHLEHSLKHYSVTKNIFKKNIQNSLRDRDGIAHNQSGNVAKAAHFVDIGWAILDHIQAIGEGVFQGAGNVAQAFLHPINTIQDTARGIAPGNKILPN